MRTITASDLKNNFGYYLDVALLEGELLITRHKRVIARLVAIKRPSDDDPVEDEENDV